MGDIFSIPNAETFVCTVKLYTSGHSLLLISVANADNQFYIGFENVRYFSGPLGWKSAKFELASHEELLKTIQQTPAFTQFAESFNLYIVQCDGFDIKILAMNAGCMSEIPSDFM